MPVSLCVFRKVGGSNWGDGRVQVINLGVGTGGLFIKKHHYNHTGSRRKTIKVTALDDEGTASAVFRITIKTFT